MDIYGGEESRELPVTVTTRVFMYYSDVPVITQI